MARWIKRSALALLVLVLLVVLVVALAAWWLMRGSLPRLDGGLALTGLSAPVTVSRDAIGVVGIDAANEVDAMRALGYVHAQERYFEMDLMRRTAAGELAGLFGARAVMADKRHRVHRMRARVEQNLDRILGDQRPVAQAYVDGVNAGLAGLRTRPWPYLLLRTEPEPWQLADSALTGYAMYFDLQDSANARELALWKIKPHLPPALFDLITRDGTEWDAPMMGRSRGAAVLPTAAELDLRQLPMPGHVDETGDSALPAPVEKGSNNFAVAAALTADGRAIVADDMHLGLRAPNIWFRAQLRYADPRAPGGRVDAGGFTLPGLPSIVVGSNGHVAWGFTNSYGDWMDWQLQPACKARCPGVTLHTERIRVAGGDDVLFEIEETRWGPILHRHADGSTLALRWSAHLPGSLNLGVSDFVRAGSIDELMRFADLAAIPAQNLLIADSTGRIAWRLLGPMPVREGDCSLATRVANTPDAGIHPPVATADIDDDPACRPWSLTTRGTPAFVDPPSGRLWTANGRVVDSAMLDRMGDGGYALGARGKQIRDALFARDRFTERDLLAIQLDDRTLFLQRWWQLLNAEAARSKTPALSELAAASTDWPTHAVPGSVSYRLVRGWRQQVQQRIAEGLTAPARAALGDDFDMPSMKQLEGVAWPLVTQRPVHLLPRRFATWEALFEDAAVELRDTLSKDGALKERNWGERNTARICHPLAGALPGFARQVLCMPADALRGDTNMPRVQGPDSGASQRMVVAPGFEADGIIHMPGGQSGHPLSPFWGAGHDDWVQGRPTPFLPGQTRYTLTLTP